MEFYLTSCLAYMILIILLTIWGMRKYKIPSTIRERSEYALEIIAISLLPFVRLLYLLILRKIVVDNN